MRLSDPDSDGGKEPCGLISGGRKKKERRGNVLAFHCAFKWLSFLIGRESLINLDIPVRCFYYKRDAGRQTPMSFEAETKKRPSM